jgi:hypothetical protein
VINPVVDIVTTAELFENQALGEAAVAVPVNCDWALTHKLVTPDIIGSGFTVTKIVWDAEQPVVAFVAVTEYEDVEVGDTVIVELLTPFWLVGFGVVFQT